MVKLLLVTLLLFANSLQAQLTVDNTPTLDEITDKIVGPGFRVVNSTMNCPGGAYGFFDGTTSNIGIDEGLILTSGRIEEAIGPNDAGSSGVNNGAPGDNQLDVLSGSTTFDGCVLEMDLIPSCDTLRISYVFGSEEYPEFVGREFNDVFAFFVSGPGIVGSQNVALIPGTTTPVAVNSVNSGTNNAYYVNNTGGATIQYDGFTTVLEGKIAVQQCEVYHLKLAIADVVDGIYESGVFIKGNSVKCATEVISADGAEVVDAIEGCDDSKFVLRRTGDYSTERIVNYFIEGTATDGVDYTSIPAMVSFPIGDSIVEIDVEALQDGVSELDETVKLIFQPGPCPIYDTVVMNIRDVKVLNSGDDVSVCSGDSVSIGRDSIIGATYSWDPVDGLSDPTALNPKFALDNISGGITVLEYVQTANYLGCDVKDTVMITLYDLPEVNIDIASACLQDEIEMRDDAGETNLVSWQWDFGDGFASINNVPNHTYTSDGNFKVELTVIDDNSCVNVDSTQITIWPLPEADFEYVGVCEESDIVFTNLSTGDIDSYKWDFDNDSDTSIVENPTYIFEEANIYDVELTVVSDSGCIGSTNQSVTIRPNPIAGFSADEVCLYSSTEFEEKASVSTGVISKFYWEFGDGTIDSINTDPTHTYGIPGKYDVQQIVVSGYGCKDTISDSVFVKSQPIADFSGNNNCIGAPSAFSDSSNAGNDEVIDKWKWTFDYLFISSDQNPSVVFADTGKHYIQLVATTAFGCADTTLDSIYVLPNPIVDFGPSDVCEGDPTVFTNKTTVANPQDTVKTFIWDFGDGSGAKIGKSPEHTFNSAVEFTVTLTATTDSGCVSSKSKDVFVHGKPKTDFEATEACEHFETEFSSRTTVSDGFIEKVYWDFSGLAVDSTTSFPTYTFLSAGSHSVSLNAISNFGCADSVRKDAIVNENPAIEIGGATDHCLGNEVSFTSDNLVNPNGGAILYKWAFGDGGVISGPSSFANHTYDLEGDYGITLTITDIKGCKDTLLDSLTVTGAPEINIYGDNLCLNDTSEFSVEIIDPGTFNWVSVDWVFGDGDTTLGDTTTVHKYLSTGEFEVTATVTSDSGCVVEVSTSTVINDFPVANFEVDTVCFGVPSKFLSKATPPPGSYISDWLWETSYGEIGAGANYTHTMLNQGEDSVTLIATTNFGCSDTIVQTVYTYEAPIVNFDVGEVEGCAPFCITMTSDILSDEYDITSIYWDLGNGNVSLDTNPEFCFQDPGMFSVELTVENELGCKGFAVQDDAINIIESPTAGFFTDYTFVSEFGSTIRFFNTADEYRSTNWYLGDSTFVSGSTDFEHVYEEPGDYLVYQEVENDAGCRDTAYSVVIVREHEAIYIPNAFTPHSTLGRNDTFYPVVYGQLRNEEYEFVIYNRWGEQLFLTNNIDEAWDGTYLGREAQQDVYAYRIKFKRRNSEDSDPIYYKGTVSLIR